MAEYRLSNVPGPVRQLLRAGQDSWFNPLDGSTLGERDLSCATAQVEGRALSLRILEYRLGCAGLAIALWGGTYERPGVSATCQAEAVAVGLAALSWWWSYNRRPIDRPQRKPCNGIRSAPNTGVLRLPRVNIPRSASQERQLPVSARRRWAWGTRPW
jgi:hypothetical protein